MPICLYIHIYIHICGCEHVCLCVCRRKGIVIKTFTKLNIHARIYIGAYKYYRLLLLQLRICVVAGIFDKLSLSIFAYQRTIQQHTNSAHAHAHITEMGILKDMHTLNPLNG